MSKGSVAVQIAGHEYKIKSEADEEWLLRVAGYVDHAMRRVREGTGTVDSLDVAVLTCLNLAREILALREARTSAIDEVKLRGLIERVEAVLAPSEASTSVDASDPKASQAIEASAGSESAEEKEKPSPEPRTLELSQFDSLRDRSGSIESGSEEEAVLDAPRAAAGGSDRGA